MVTWVFNIYIDRFVR